MRKGLKRYPENSTSNLSAELSNPFEECYNDEQDGDLEILEMEKRKKEILVKKKHKYKIIEPTEKYPYYKTRIAGDKQIVKKDKCELIDELYDMYYPRKDVHIPTLREAVNDWITSREKNKTIEYLTANHYRTDFKKYLSRTRIADMPIDEIKKQQVYFVLESIAGDGSNMPKRTLSNVKTVLNGAFDYANMFDGIDCIDVKRIRISDLIRKCKGPQHSDATYTREEAEILVDYLNKQKPTVYNLGIRLMFCLSVRVGELRAITWEDYDKENYILHLRHSIVTKKEGVVNRKFVDVDYMKAHSDTGKRDLELSDYAIYLLEELEKLTGNCKYILQSKGDMPITTNNFNDHLKTYCNACGIDYKSSHKIRFYACSMMYDAGYDEKTIQANMGHSSLAMTRHYDRRQRKGVERDLINSTFGFNFPTGDGINQLGNP